MVLSIRVIDCKSDKGGHNLASKLEFVEYVADQLGEAGEITYRKMFGEYGIYCDGKFFATVCDDQLFFKITEGGRKLMPDLEEGIPYHGAKPHFLIEELEDREQLAELVRTTCRELPMPKPKKKKGAADGAKGTK